MVKWQEILTQNGLDWTDEDHLAPGTPIRGLEELRRFLDAVHIRLCLAKPYQENGDNYPLVESRELLPSFDNAMFEYKNLPGFSLVAFERPLSYFSERFQYDQILPAPAGADQAALRAVNQANLQTMLSRVPRVHQDIFRSQFARDGVSYIANYPALMPYLANLDRGHVLAEDSAGGFHLAGIYASFVNDIDSALKRFGLKIGKFALGDSELYAKNRMFVYQFLMELYGFPVVSERRTSAAMFARMLNRRGERFLLRVLGQTDRTITTYVADGTTVQAYPQIDKTALVAVDSDQQEAIDAIAREGFFLDAEKRVVILRVRYRQHRYNPENVRQDRALSVAGQEIVHPLTGRVLKGLNIIRDATNMYLRLNDIVRGEYQGRVVYKRNEIIESTDHDENRLKVLSYWLTKHQRRIIDYSDDFYGKVAGVLQGYLFSPEKDDAFESVRELHREVCARLGYIQQARHVRVLEELKERMYRGQRVHYRRMMQLSLEIANNLKFEIVNFFPELVEKAVACLDRILSDRYLVRTYIHPPEGAGAGKPALSRAGLEIRKAYGALVSAQDELKAALRLRAVKDREKEKDREKDGASRNREAKDSARDMASGGRGRAPQNEPSASPATA